LPVPDAARAESHFNAALAIARRQQAKSWELRSATSCARLMRDGPRTRSSGPARTGLRLVHRGLVTKDLKEAKALMDDLADAPALPASGGLATGGAGPDGG
jgi:hypothetical protein